MSGAGAVSNISKRHNLGCRACGQAGYLSITTDHRNNWSFAGYGFVGIAVDHFKLENSVFRCNSCRSLDVFVDPEA